MSISTADTAAARPEEPEILRPESAEEVAAAVRRAVAEGRRLTVRGGGHGFWKSETDGLTIDLGRIAGVEVGDPDADGALVRIGAGAVWGDVAKALAPHGLAISSGDTASVGVGGLVTGGGIGLLVRDRGLAIDQLRAAQVVTADGRVVETSASEEPDLFWAIRGGGGNFGVLTRLDFIARPLTGLLAGELTADGDQAVFLKTVRDALAAAPRALTVSYMDVPAMDPSAPAGARLGVVWASPDEAGLADAIRPLTALERVTGQVRPTPYAQALLEMPHDPDEVGPSMLSMNGLFRALDDTLIDRLVAFRRAHPASVLFLRSLGGAFGDVPDDATPFPGREATWFVMALAFDFPGALDDAGRDQVRAELADLAEGRLAAYANFSDPASLTSTAQCHSPQSWDRLRRLKATWDPQNVFTRNHNIPPAV